MGVLETLKRARKCKFGLMRSKLPTLGRAVSELACLLAVCTQCENLGQEAVAKPKKA